MNSMDADAKDVPETEAQVQMRKKHAAIMAIQLDTSLTEAEKAQKRQLIMMGSWAKPQEPGGGQPTCSWTGACIQRVCSQL